MCFWKRKVITVFYFLYLVFTTLSLFSVFFNELSSYHHYKVWISVFLLWWYVSNIFKKIYLNLQKKQQHNRTVRTKNIDLLKTLFKLLQNIFHYFKYYSKVKFHHFKIDYLLSLFLEHHIITYTLRRKYLRNLANHLRIF